MSNKRTFEMTKEKLIAKVKANEKGMKKYPCGGKNVPFKGRELAKLIQNLGKQHVQVRNRG